MILHILFVIAIIELMFFYLHFFIKIFVHKKIIS